MKQGAEVALWQRLGTTVATTLLVTVQLRVVLLGGTLSVERQLLVL